MEFIASQRGALDDALRARVLAHHAVDGAEGFDVWLSEGAQGVSRRQSGEWTLSRGREGLYGQRRMVGEPDWEALVAEALALAPGGLTRLWAAGDVAALRAAVATLPTPVVTTFVQSDQARLAFFSAAGQVVMLQNPRSQEPAGPGRARGAVVDHGGQRLILSEAVNGVGEGGDLYEQLWCVIDRVRNLISQFNLKDYGIEYGFGLEDMRQARIHLASADDRDFIDGYLARLLSPDCQRSYIEAGLEGGALLALEGVFVKKGESLEPGQAKYALTAEGRIRVEAFELHVVEHCNLRCAHCCNMSPYVSAHTLSVDEVERQCRRAAEFLVADVFKIMGGEPLLHPQITEVIRAVRSTSISKTVRLFTNGLLLHRMDDAFWEALDHLTISSYSSAPVKADKLQLARDKAREFGVILNIKQVDRFNQVLAARPHRDDDAVQAVYDDCWLRHRCLIVRNGRFFKCTRAAYYADFQRRMELELPDPDPDATMAGDGIELDAPDFLPRALAYLNSDAPLAACRFCLGGSGALFPHEQLSRQDVAQGRLFSTRNKGVNGR